MTPLLLSGTLSLFVFFIVSRTNANIYDQEVYQSRHLGCFSDTKLKRHKFYTKVKPILTWEICLHLCANKFTRYIGVQTSTNLCYCGEALLQLSEKTDLQSCNPCTDNQKHYCGGETTVSLYQFRPRDRVTLLLATDQGIELLDDKSTEYTIVSANDIYSVGYHGAKQDIYFIERDTILRSSYIPVLMSYFPPTKVIEKSKPLTDLTVDWVNNKLFWNCDDTQGIYEANFDGTNEKQRLYNAPQLRDLTYEPYKKLIFSLYDQKMSSITDSKELDRYILDKYLFNEIKELALDVHLEMIYLIGSFKSGKQRCLANTNYNASTFSVLYCGPELSTPTALDVFNDTVFWVNYNNPKYYIYTSQISPRGRLENLTLFHQTEKKISKLKIFHPEVQTPSPKRSCELLACSHQCRVVTFSAVECTCPARMSLKADGRTCTELENAGITTSNFEPSSKSTIGDTESSEEDFTSEITTTDYSSSYSVSSVQPEEFPTEDSFQINLLNKSLGLKLSAKSSLQSSHEVSQIQTSDIGVTNSHILVTMFLCFLVIAALLSGILYVQLKFQKGHHNCNRELNLPLGSELEMLTHSST